MTISNARFSDRGSFLSQHSLVLHAEKNIAVTTRTISFESQHTACETSVSLRDMKKKNLVFLFLRPHLARNSGNEKGYGVDDDALGDQHSSPYVPTKGGKFVVRTRSRLER